VRSSGARLRYSSPHSTITAIATSVPPEHSVYRHGEYNGAAGRREARAMLQERPATHGAGGQRSVTEVWTATTSYPPIADYAVIGDCHTAALVSRQGSIDWYCPGRFDAPAVFCRLLDAQRGGYFQVAPTGQYSSTRHYHGPTNVLVTEYEAGGGRVRLTDLMPVVPRSSSARGDTPVGSRQILRLIEGLAGTTELSVVFAPTFDYARAETRVDVVAGQGVVAHAAGDWLTLSCPTVEWQTPGSGALTGHRRVRAGDRVWHALTGASDEDGARGALMVDDADEALARTLAYWQRWADRCSYQGPYRAAVLRSALTLKLLTYEPSGALVAAPTTSLPEDIGGVRNWDYRYSWLRDSSLILYALLTVGYDAEAEDFIGWLHRTCSGQAEQELRVMYALDGGQVPAETTLDHLGGYRASRPVRIGNAAAQQHQHDIFGDVLVTADLNFRRPNSRRGRIHELTVPEPTWALLRGFADGAAAHWQEPDRGIWEVRGGPQRFLYSAIRCWAALDRAIKLAEAFSLEAPSGDWRAVRAQIRRAILTDGYNPHLGAFTQAFGSQALDASVLAIPRLGFLPASDPRMRSTVDCIQRELTHDGLVLRYTAPDGLPGDEGTFVLCSFWLVDALALAGRLEEAHALLDRLIGYVNDVGLLSEEIDAANGALLGNFPQGFSHLALIGAAVNLAKATKHGAEHRAETDTDRVAPARQAAAEGSHP
jgi:alpha,alpha-trehalase